MLLAMPSASVSSTLPRSMPASPVSPMAPPLPAAPVSPALPAGLDLNTTSGVVSGTPTVAATVATYTVTGTNATGNVARLQDRIANAQAEAGMARAELERWLPSFTG